MVINQRVITNNSLMPGAGRGGRKGPAEKVLTSAQMLSRLATNPRDAEALISVYEHYEREIREAAISWFGNKRCLYGQAVNNILVAIGRQAGSYDPHFMDAAQWVRNCADTEARRLREALDKAVGKSLRTRRAM
jgi:hypothetical protein